MQQQGGAGVANGQKPGHARDDARALGTMEMACQKNWRRSSQGDDGCVLLCHSRTDCLGDQLAP